jgi:hypothetical protein
MALELSARASTASSAHPRTQYISTTTPSPIISTGLVRSARLSHPLRLQQHQIDVLSAGQIPGLPEALEEA